jgi:hypothetical protein
MVFLSPLSNSLIADTNGTVFDPAVREHLILDSAMSIDGNDSHTAFRNYQSLIFIAESDILKIIFLDRHNVGLIRIQRKVHNLLKHPIPSTLMNVQFCC